MKKVTIAVFLALVLLVGGWALVRSILTPDDGPVTRAALSIYKTATGETHAEVAHSSLWKRCAIVAVYDAGSEHAASLAMVTRNGRWVLGRMSSDQVGFDSDDIGDESDCLAVAHSTGSLSHGEPDSP